MATGVARNPNFAKLAGGYLFPEIGRRRLAYLAQHPEMADRIISLGIGDTTQPIPSHILGGLVNGASKLELWPPARNADRFSSLMLPTLPLFGLRVSPNPFLKLRGPAMLPLK
jgi:hypothetical protein